MTLVSLGKGLVLRGWPWNIEVIWVLGKKTTNCTIIPFLKSHFCFLKRHWFSKQFTIIFRWLVFFPKDSALSKKNHLFLTPTTNVTSDVSFGCFYWSFWVGCLGFILLIYHKNQASIIHVGKDTSNSTFHPEKPLKTQPLLTPNTNP